MPNGFSAANAAKTNYNRVGNQDVLRRLDKTKTGIKDRAAASIQSSTPTNLREAQAGGAAITGQAGQETLAATGSAAKQGLELSKQDAAKASSDAALRQKRRSNELAKKQNELIASSNEETRKVLKEIDDLNNEGIRDRAGREYLNFNQIAMGRLEMAKDKQAFEQEAQFLRNEAAKNEASINRMLTNLTSSIELKGKQARTKKEIAHVDNLRKIKRSYEEQKLRNEINKKVAGAKTAAIRGVVTTAATAVGTVYGGPAGGMAAGAGSGVIFDTASKA